MTTITREQQKQILIDTANHVINRDNTSPYSENLRELARIALASLTAEPVLYAAEETLAYAKHGELHLTCLSEPMGDAVVPLYATPPAQRMPDMNGFRPCPFCNSPVKWCGENSADPEDDHACHHIQCTNPECGADFDFTNTGDDLLPDDPAILDAMTTTELLQPLRAICKSRFNRRTTTPAPVVPDEMTPQQASRSYGGEVRGYRDGWNACRAAMLQSSNDGTNGKQLTIPLPDTGSKAFWSGTGKSEVFHPETYKRWVKEAIERSCAIAGIGVEVK